MACGSSLLIKKLCYEDQSFMIKFPKPNIITYYEPVKFKVLIAVTTKTHDFLRYDAMYTSCLLPIFSAPSDLKMEAAGFSKSLLMS